MNNSISEQDANCETDSFALMVVGNSMYPAYEDGDIIIANKKIIPVTGDDVIACVSGCNEFKRIIVTDNSITLRCLFQADPAYAMKTYSNEEIKTLPVEIVGVVCEMRRTVKKDKSLQEEK